MFGDDSDGLSSELSKDAVVLNLPVGTWQAVEQRDD